MVKRADIANIKKDLNDLLIMIIDNDNHLLLYNKKFWFKHFKVVRKMRQIKKEYALPKKSKISYTLWLKFIPILLILWLVIYIAIMLLIDSHHNFDFSKEATKLILFPHTILIILLYHYLANKSLIKYKCKIKQLMINLGNKSASTKVL